MTSSDRSCSIVCLTDVTDPEAARSHPCVRTLADDEGNRYVLLTTAQYLRLLSPGAEPLPPVNDSTNEIRSPELIGQSGDMEGRR